MTKKPDGHEYAHGHAHKKDHPQRDHRSSPSKQGPSKQGPSKQGPSKQGPSKQGPSKQGPSKQGPSKQGGVHKDWRFWAVILMLVGMAIYVLSGDEQFVPGEPPGQAVPAMDGEAE